jgi:hypothetical protein
VAAALIVLALLARRRGRFALAGCLLGFAVLLKYYPAVLVPLFALDAGRLRMRLIAAAAVVTFVGLAAGWLVWGNALFQPLMFAVERDPKMLSVLSALAAHPNLIGGQGILDLLLRTNVAFVVAAGLIGGQGILELLLRTNVAFVAAVGLIVFVVAWRTQMHWIEASVIGLLAVLLTYKVGHPQFYLPWVFLVAALPLAATRSADWLAWICLPMLLFLSAFQWGYAYGSDGYHVVLGNIRRDVGFVAFALGIATLAADAAQRRSLARNMVVPERVSPNPNSGY